MEEPYFCTKCKRKHFRGSIYERHLKYKEIEKEIPQSDKFIMRGKKGEELEVRVNKRREELRINIYKNNQLACSTHAPANQELLKRNNIRNYIESHCF
jgi:hypothetical protein